MLQIGELLGHKQAGTTKRYSKFVDRAKADAADKVGRQITAIMNAPDEPEGEVVPLHLGEDR